MTSYRLSPPTLEEKLGRPFALWWAGVRRGVSLVKTSGAWSQVQFPDQATLSAADDFYLGGHVYTVDDARRSELLAARVVDSSNFEVIL